MARKARKIHGTIVSLVHNNVDPTYQVPTMQLWVSFDNSFIGSLNGASRNKGLHKAAKSEPWRLPKNHLRDPCSCLISTINCLNLLSKPEPELLRVLIISKEKTLLPCKYSSIHIANVGLGAYAHLSEEWLFDGYIYIQ